MPDINLNVRFPNQITTEVITPTYDNIANVLIPGPQGPRGEKGDKGEIGDGLTVNGLSGILYLTGADGIRVLATGNNIIVVSGNSGYFQNLIDELFNTGRFLSGSLEVLGSGLFRLGVKVGLDSVLITPNNIFIEGDPVVTDSKFNQLSGYFENENTVGFSHALTAGNDTFYVQYPYILSSNPRSISCIFQNQLNNMIYYPSISNIDKTGFYVNLSDIVSENGYYLNINVKK